MRPVWIWRSQSSATHQIGTQSVTPIYQSIGFRWSRGGWIWQFPLAVDVQDKRAGDHKRLPIPDPTRLIVWSLFALTLFLVFVTIRTSLRGRKRK